jgi:hypothetical protein
MPVSQSTKLSSVFSRSSATTSSQKGKGKQLFQEAFADDSQNDAMVYASLTADKHTCKMAEHQQHMAELEIKKQCLTLKAQTKQLEADEHCIAAQHQCNCERELYEMELLRICMQYQGGGGPLGGLVSLDSLPIWHSLVWNSVKSSRPRISLETWEWTVTI